MRRTFFFLPVLLATLPACTSREDTSRDSSVAPEVARAAPRTGPDGPPAESDQRLEALRAELSLRDQERAALARHYRATGDVAFQELDYARAAEAYRKAEAADSRDAGLVRQRERAELLAGDRRAEFRAITEELALRRTVSIQAQAADLRRHFADAEELFRRASTSERGPASSTCSR